MATKTDVERVGFFSESGYTTIGDPYVSPTGNTFNESAAKGKQMVISGTKSKAASQCGYFDATFNRILQGEAYSDPVKLRRKRRLMEAKKNLGGSWIPSSVGKLPSGVGGHYGTFSGPMSAFSAVQRLQQKYKTPGKNFLTNPGKMGTGYGYIGVTLGPTYKYSSEPYDVARDIRNMQHKAAKSKEKGGPFKLHCHPSDFFDENPYYSRRTVPALQETKVSDRKPKPFKPSSPAKKAGGCKAGTFNSYPEHSDDPYEGMKHALLEKSGSKKYVFKPSAGPKTKPTTSVLQHNVMRSVNGSNFQTVTSTGI